MNNYFLEQTDKLINFNSISESYKCVIDTLIKNYQDKNVIEFFDYYYSNTHDFHNLYDFSLFSSNNCIFNIEIQQQSIVFSTKSNSFVDDIFNNQDFYKVVKSLKTKNKNEEYLKKVFLDYFDITELTKEKQEQHKNLSNESNRFSYFYESNANNFNHTFDHHIPKKVISELSKEEIDSFLIKKQRCYFIKNSQNVFYNARTYSENSYIRELANKLIMNVGTLKNHNHVLDNKELAYNIISNEKTKSILLGYKNYLSFSNDKNLLNNSDKVISLLEFNKAEYYDFALFELKELRDWIKEKYNVNNLKKQDLDYYISKYKKSKTNIKEEDINCYFNLSNVIHGCFKKYSDMFNLTFKEIDNFKMINKDFKIKTFEIYYKNIFKGHLILDLLQREGKSENPYVEAIRNGSKYSDSIIYVNLDLLDENYIDVEFIKKFMHEMGHVTERVLYQSDFIFDDLYEHSDKDACEVISSIMETFANDSHFLFDLSKEINGEKIKIETLEEYLKIEKFFSSFERCKTTALSGFDHDVYSKDNIELSTIQEDNKSKYIPFYNEFDESFIYNFVHCFDGYYSANYYSYLLADTISKTLFEEIKDNPKKQKLFKHKMLIRQNKHNFKEAILDFYENEIPKDLSFIFK